MKNSTYCIFNFFFLYATNDLKCAHCLVTLESNKWANLGDVFRKWDRLTVK